MDYLYDLDITSNENRCNETNSMLMDIVLTFFLSLRKGLVIELTLYII